jgi:hypothetical protein
MFYHRLLNNFTDRHTGIKGTIGILKDYLHISAISPQFFLLEPAKVNALKKNFPFGGFSEAQN